MTVGAKGVSEEDLIVHRPRDPELLYASMLSQLSSPDFPSVAGILRQVERPTYEGLVDEQITAARAKKTSCDLGSLLRGEHSWTV